MEPLHNHNSSNDSYDYLIAFVVIIGALAFVLQQSFYKKLSLDSSPLSQTIPEKVTQEVSRYNDIMAVSDETSPHENQLTEQQQFEDDTIDKWTEKLEKQQIENTPFSTPLKSTTKDLMNSSPVPLSKEVAEPQKAPSTNIVKEQPVFIDTESREKTTLSKAKDQLVKTYDATSPKITTTQSEFVEKGKASQNTPTKKSATRIRQASEGKKSCIIVIAALQDAENVKRLVKSLEEDNYTVYNKLSGKYRTIGVKTSCEPNIYQPLLKTIKQTYSQDAWLSKSR